MALNDIIDYCVTQALTVSGIGVVRDHERLVVDDKGIRDHFMAAGVINAVEITRRASRARALTNQGVERDHDIVFHVYYGLQESSATELIHRNLVESLFEKFRLDFRLGGNANRVEPLQVEFSGQIEKAGKLLHYATCILPVQEDIY